MDASFTSRTRGFSLLKDSFLVTGWFLDTTMAGGGQKGRTHVVLQFLFLPGGVIQTCMSPAS